MALNNFAALTASMQSWSIDRPDLVPIFQDCIDLCINDVNSVLRMPDQITEVSLTPDPTTGEVPLPDDLLEIRSVVAMGLPMVSLQPLTTEGSVDKYPELWGSPSTNYVVSDGVMTILPLGTDPIQLEYWAKVPKLTPIPPNDVNWLLLKNSNVIFFGAMKYVEVFKRNDKGMQSFGQLYSAEIDGLVRQGKRAQWGRTRARVYGRSTP